MFAHACLSCNPICFFSDSSVAESHWAENPGHVVIAAHRIGGG